MTHHDKRQALLAVLRHAILEVRMLCRAGKARQAAALADAVHRIPDELWQNEFDIQSVLGELERYQSKYPGGHDYVGIVNEVSKKVSTTPRRRK